MTLALAVYVVHGVKEYSYIPKSLAHHPGIG